MIEYDRFNDDAKVLRKNYCKLSDVFENLCMLCHVFEHYC